MTTIIRLAVLPLLAACLLATNAWADPPPPTFYNLGRAVPQSQLMDLGPPEALGGEVLAGNPRISARFDLMLPTASAGVFQVTRGKLRVTYPFTEHATVISGVMIITDANGHAQIYGPGDSYLIRQGTVIVVDVITPTLQKSFYNVVETQ